MKLYFHLLTLTFDTFTHNKRYDFLPRTLLFRLIPFAEFFIDIYLNLT